MILHCLFAAHLGFGYVKPDPHILSEFLYAYQARATNVGSSKPDAAIQKAMVIVSSFVIRAAKEHDAVSPKMVDGIIEDFRKALLPKGTSEVPLDDFRSLDAEVSSSGGLKFVVLRMGNVTRSFALNRRGIRINLPEFFEWNSPWMPTFRAFPNGIVLAIEDRIQSAGMRTKVRFVWMKADDYSANVLVQHNAFTSLDLLPPRINGNQVMLSSIEEPRAFTTGSSIHPFVRDEKWMVTAKGPKLQESTLREPELRAVDTAIYDAYGRQRPNGLESRIRSAWPFPPGSVDSELLSWTKKPGSKGKVIVLINRRAKFEVLRSADGYQVVSAQRQ